MNEIKDSLLENPGLLILVSVLIGYLFGSLSFAKLVYFTVTGKWKMEPFSEQIPNSEKTFDSDLVSATTVGKKLGPRYGCVTSIGDMVKIALPVLLFKLWFTEEPYFLIVTVFGVIGHNYPIFSGFVGGRGDSPILGALLVINWFGVLISHAAAAILGFITGSVMVMRFGGIVLLIFWFWIYFQDIRYVLCMVILNILYWFSLRKDLKRFFELKKNKDVTITEEAISEFLLMGKSTGRFLDNNSLYSLWKKRYN